MREDETLDNMTDADADPAARLHTWISSFNRIVPRGALKDLQALTQALCDIAGDAGFNPPGGPLADLPGLVSRVREIIRTTLPADAVLRTREDVATAPITGDRVGSILVANGAACLVEDWYDYDANGVESPPQKWSDYVRSPLRDGCVIPLVLRPDEPKSAQAVETLADVRTERDQLRTHLGRLESMLALDAPYPIHSTLTQLANATDHLLNDHNCDMDGWELAKAAAESARRIVAALESYEPDPYGRASDAVAAERLSVSMWLHDCDEPGLAGCVSQGEHVSGDGEPLPSLHHVLAERDAARARVEELERLVAMPADVLALRKALAKRAAKIMWLEMAWRGQERARALSEKIEADLQAELAKPVAQPWVEAGPKSFRHAVNLTSEVSDKGWAIWDNGHKIAIGPECGDRGRYVSDLAFRGLGYRLMGGLFSRKALDVQEALEAPSSAA